MEDLVHPRHSVTRRSPRWVNDSTGVFIHSPDFEEFYKMQDEDPVGFFSGQQGTCEGLVERKETIVSLEDYV